jgi:hypothetical protein
MGRANPRRLDGTALMVWGLVAHLVADWPLQNDWMASRKADLRHPAGYVHAGIHGSLVAPVFGWVAAPLALAHLLIDTRVPVVWWSRLIGQTQPAGYSAFASRMDREPTEDREGHHEHCERPLYDVGTEVRLWTDQVFHVACIAVAALALGGRASR